jgi:ankyrin repeat protein
MAKREKQVPDPNARAGDESQRLVQFARQGRIDSVKEFLQSPSTSFSATALIEGFFSCLSQKRDLELVDLFFSRGLDPNAKLPRFTPLGGAAMCGNTKLIELMIDHGCEVNLPAQNGDTSLHSCCARGAENRNPQVRAGCLEVAKLLIERGADVNRINQEGKTPLDYACAAIHPGWAEMITLLLESGARIDRCENGGATCVMHVGISASDEPLKALLNHGVDPNSRDASGLTPLMYAAGFAIVSRAKLLLDHGAKVLLRDNSGTTALDRARASDGPSTAEFIALLEQAAKTESPEPQGSETAGPSTDVSSSPQKAAASRIVEAKVSRTKVRIFPDLVGTYRLDPQHTAALDAKFFHDRFPMKPGFDEAVRDHWSEGAKNSEVAGIRLIIEDTQITLRAADASEEAYWITKTWNKRGRRFIAVDMGGMSVQFEIKQYGESSIQLACDYHELGEFAWMRE